MMAIDTNTLKNYALGTLTIALLASLGFVVLVDDTHICRSLELLKHCDRLSDTGRTCYPTPGTTVGKKLCPEPWEEIMAEPEPVMPEPDTEITTIHEPSNIGTVWTCGQGPCVRIK